MIKQTKLLISLFSLFHLSVLSAQPNIDSLFLSLNEQWAKYPAEFVYLQTSKGIYEAGEDLWFKAYALDAQSIGLSGRSQTLYLQMVNEKDSTVWQEKYPIENGIAHGHLYVDEKLQDGNYSLEAYTRHSFSRDTTAMVSTRKIRVVKSIAKENRQPPKGEDRDWRFNLFPEGGNLIADIPSRLAFKATDGKGYPVDVVGTLFEDEDTVTTFQSSHDGMGLISLTPSARKRYRIELANGQRYPLPEIHLHGVSLQLIKQDDEFLEFLVSKSRDLPEQQIYLLGQLRGMVCCMAKGTLRNSLKIKIPIKEFLYQGISEFTLLDETMRPIAERLVYLHPKKKLNITVESDSNRYALRQKATLNIKVTDEEGNPVKAHLGIGVFDKAYSNPDDPVNIFTHCYLSSQIRGKIHNPTYYFNEENKDRLQAMELLLLTQGWRRYLWNTENTTNCGELFLTDEIMGVQSIKSKKKSRQEQGTDQLIQVSGAEGNTQFVWADSTGLFTIGTDMMKELRGGYVYLKPMLSDDFKPTLLVQDLFSVIDTVRKRKPNTYPIVDLSQHKKEITFIQPVISNDSTVLLDEVTIKGKGKRLFRDKFMGRLDSLAQKDLGPWVCKHGWLENYKEGYTHHHDPRYCPSVVDDGEPRTAPVIGKSYHIMKAEYYPCNARGGWCFKPLDHQWIVYEGAIYSEEELLRMNNLWRTKGYYAAREFYQPDEIDMQMLTPDARNTLLWQPTVMTDKKGEASVSFYCSDINTEFIGVVEGVDGTGLVGAGMCEFRVLRK